MRRPYEIIKDACRIIGGNMSPEEFIRVVVITHDDMHGGKYIIGLHHNECLVQYLLDDVEYKELQITKRNGYFLED